MIIGYFTERPYRWVPEDEVLRNEGFFAVSNKYFDREKAADDYNYFLDEYCYAEELGFDALMLNEHHGNPFCMGSVMNVEASILARITKKAKIVLIGNPLPVLKHPLRMAEELAEIDLISRGRLVAGWVRGAGSEQFFNNANPAYNREYFNEAHDFIIQAWTRPGPWRYEGRHFHYRHVNPWALPYQKPHPQMWIPGVLSPETVRWCAEHAYPYIGLVTSLGPTCDLWDFYADIAAEHGYQAGPENFGYLMGVFVADTDERAQKNYLMIVGSPKTALEKIKTIMGILRPSIFTVFQVQGPVSNEDRMNRMRLLAQEIMPAMKEYAKEIDLPDPFERFPGSVKLQSGSKRAPVVDRTPLASLKLGSAE